MIPGLPYDVVNQTPFTTWKGPKGSLLHLVNTPAEWEAFYDAMSRQKIVACDTETNGFHYFANNRIVGMSFGWGIHNFYIPVRHVESLQDGPQIPQLSMDYLRPMLQQFFARKDVFTIWHNAKFDFHFYEVDDIPITTPFHDTLIGWKLKNETAPAALKTIATGWRDEFGRWRVGLIGKGANDKEKEVDRWRTDEAKARRLAFNQYVMEKANELETEMEFQGWKRNDLKKYIKNTIAIGHPYSKSTKSDIHYGYVPIELMTQYAAIDTYLTWLVYQDVVEYIKKRPKLTQVYIKELKYTRTLCETEGAGVKMDRPYLIKLGKQLAEEAEALSETIKDELGPEFVNINLGSTDQLSAAFIQKGLKLTKKTESGKWALDSEVLKELAEEYPVAKNVKKLRELEKLKSTYVDGILSKLTPNDFLHCSYNQIVNTGRSSCTDPNLQNIPAGSKLIRKAFINLGPEYLYVFADYSQIELRLTADRSQDPIMMDAYAKGQDLHTRALCEMFGYDYDYVLSVLDSKDHPEKAMFKNLRTIAKRINFGIIYGVGPPGLARQTGKSVEECRDYINTYLRKYIGVKRMMNEGKRYVRAHGEVENNFGRIRHIPTIYADKILPGLRSDLSPEELRRLIWMFQGRSERQAVNYWIQGEAADLFKEAAVRVHDLFKKKAKYSRLVNFIHDEIQAYIHQDEMFLLKEMKERMEDFKYSVPIIVEFEASKTDWSEKQHFHVE